MLIVRLLFGYLSIEPFEALQISKVPVHWVGGAAS